MRASILKALLALLILTACAPATSPLEGRLAAVESETEKISVLEGELATLQQQVSGVQEASPFDVAVIQYVLDSAGFHEIAETLAATKTIDPAYLNTVNRVKKVLDSAPWPHDLAEQGQAFATLLDSFGQALEADNGDQAAELADQVHEAQHDLSHEIDAWLGAAGGSH